MLILPSETNKKCGLLNYLNEKNKTNPPTIFIPENRYTDNFNSDSTVIDCNYESDWASSTTDQSISFKLNNYKIIPYYVSITRRRDYAYPDLSRLEGFDITGWTNICNLSFSFETYSETRIQSCKGTKYYSSLRLLQDHSSSALNYMEFHSFDIFGSLIYNYSTIPNQKSFPFKFVPLIFVTLSS